MKLDGYITIIEDSYPGQKSVMGRLLDPGAPLVEPKAPLQRGAFAFNVPDADAHRYEVGERLTVTIVKKRYRCQTD